MSTITEADVFFEMFLPLLCKERAAAMERFSGTIVFEQIGSEPRVWTVKGGKKPWVQRGDAEKADARIALDTELVKAVVRGYTIDMNQALAVGAIRLSGRVDVLQELGFTWSESKRLLDVMLKR